MSVIDEEIQQTQRAAVRDRLTDTGMDPELAERWCDAWEARAALQRIMRSAGYWEIGRSWIDAQRAAGKSPPY